MTSTRSTSSRSSTTSPRPRPPPPPPSTLRTDVEEVSITTKATKPYQIQTNDDVGSPGIRTVGSEITALSTPVTIKHQFETASSTVHTGHKSRSTLGSLLLNKWILGGVAVAILGASVGGGIWSFLQIPGLNHQIAELERQVNRLESEVDRLETQNDRYQVLNDNLNQTAMELQITNVELQGTADRLDGTVDRLNGTVTELEQVNRDLTQENERYAELNAELNTILEFLNETAQNLNESYEDIVAFLAEQISVNRVLVLQTLENTYGQITISWDCTFRDVFRGEAFVVDEDSPIGSDSLPDVLDHVEERILSELCIDTADFEAFLNSRYLPLDSMTTNQLYSAVAVYVIAAMNYYFPDSGEPGLTPEDWASADYSCENVIPFSSAAQ